MLKNLLILITLCFVTSFWSASVSASEVAQLEEADIVVPSRALDVKNAALKQALATVFVKNSGRAAVVSHPLIKAQVNQPELLLTQYGYNEIDGELILKASFDHQRIISLLREADLPVWGKQRPLTLIWLTTVDESGQPIILSDDANLEVSTSIKQESINAGIPVMLPLMDLDDAMLINVSDVRGSFTDVVERASTRYQADYFAIVNVEQQETQVQFQISLFNKTRTNGVLQPLILQQGKGKDMQESFLKMANILADYYVTQFASSLVGEGSGATVSFTGIRNMKQMVQIESYLSQLSAVKSVSMQQMKADTVSFKVTLFGSAEDLQRLLSLNTLLSKVEDETEFDPFSNETVSKPASLIYQWLGQ